MRRAHGHSYLGVCKSPNSIHALGFCLNLQKVNWTTSNNIWSSKCCCCCCLEVKRVATLKWQPPLSSFLPIVLTIETMIINTMWAHSQSHVKHIILVLVLILIIYRILMFEWHTNHNMPPKWVSDSTTHVTL